MKISEIEFGSQEYQDSVQLRNSILRIPLGMNLYEEDLSHEVADFHFAAVENDEVMGCLILSLKSETIVKMRQVAVAAEARNLGVGKALVTHSEHWARMKGYQTIELHARKEAVSFYVNLNYSTVGDEFVEVGIPHVKMFKSM